MQFINLSIQIESSNAAFITAPKEEVCRILNKVVSAIEIGTKYGNCKDINGNTVGYWSLTINEENEDDL